jgi:hypothetical protein
MYARVELEELVKVVHFLHNQKALFDSLECYSKEIRNYLEI